MKITIPEKAKKVMAMLNDCGFSAFVVGGCVRDSIIGVEPGDWDICTDASPEEMLSCFGNLHVIKTGMKHGTVTVVLEGEPFEVTAYRIESGYSDYRRPDSVEFTKDIRKDLARRDFTVNAMAYSDEAGLVDIYGGCDDISRKILRCVGDPGRRFNEDALRIMRCVRFSSQLLFAVEQDTEEAMFANAGLLDNIAAERICEEFTKMLCGAGAEGVLRKYREIIAGFIPEIRDSFECDQQNDYHIFDVWEHIIHTVGNIPTEKILRLTAFFHDIGKPACKTVKEGDWAHFYHHERESAAMATAIMGRLKFDNKTRDTVTELISRHGIVFDPRGKQPGRLLNKLGEEKLRYLIELERADVKSQAPFCIAERLANIRAFEEAIDEMIENEKCFSLKDLKVDGNDIIGMGIPAGPRVGNLLNSLLEDVIDGKIINEKAELLAAVKNKPPAVSE